MATAASHAGTFSNFGNGSVSQTFNIQCDLGQGDDYTIYYKLALVLVSFLSIALPSCFLYLALSIKYLSDAIRYHCDPVDTKKEDDIEEAGGSNRLQRVKRFIHRYREWVMSSAAILLGVFVIGSPPSIDLALPRPVTATRE